MRRNELERNIKKGKHFNQAAKLKWKFDGRRT